MYRLIPEEFLISKYRNDKFLYEVNHKTLLPLKTNIFFNEIITFKHNRQDLPIFLPKTRNAKKDNMLAHLSSPDKHQNLKKNKNTKKHYIRPKCSFLPVAKESPRKFKPIYQLFSNLPEERGSETDLKTILNTIIFINKKIEFHIEIDIGKFKTFFEIHSNHTLYWEDISLMNLNYFNFMFKNKCLIISNIDKSLFIKNIKELPTELNILKIPKILVSSPNNLLYLHKENPEKSLKLCFGDKEINLKKKLINFYFFKVKYPKPQLLKTFWKEEEKKYTMEYLSEFLRNWQFSNIFHFQSEIYFKITQQL